MAEYVMDKASTYLDGKDYNHGDTIDLDPERGKELEEAGVVVPKSKWDSHLKDQASHDTELEKARVDAEKAAADAEARKVAANAAARAEQAAVPPRRRGRPPAHPVEAPAHPVEAPVAEGDVPRLRGPR